MQGDPSGWRRAGIGALAGLVMLLGASAALGQPQPDLDVEKALRRGGKTRVPAAVERSAGAVRPPEAAPIQAEVQWGLWRETEVEDARERHFDSFMRLSRELGQTPRTWHGLAMVQEAAAAMDAGDFPRAEARLSDARQADPHLPAPEFAQVALELRRSPGAVLPAWRALRAGWSKGLRWLPTRYEALAEGVHALVWGLGLVGVALLALAMTRHLRLLAADASRLLPRGATVGQLQLLGLALIAAPGLLTGSPVASLLTGLALLGAYMGWAERGAALLVLAGLAALPTAASLRERALRFPASDVYEVWRASATPCDMACAERVLAAGADKKDEEPGLGAARRLIHATRLLQTTREGAGYTEAAQALEPLAGDATLDARLRAAARNNLAVARVMTGAPAEAGALLRDASGDAPTLWAPRLNLARLHELEGRDADAQTEVQQAILLGGGDAAERSVEAERTVNLWFELMPASPQALAGIWEQRRFDGEGGAAAWRGALGGLPLGSMEQVAGGAAAALVLLTLAGIALKAARRCRRCGQEMFERAEGPRAARGEVCQTCATCFGGGNLTYHERVAHEEIAQRWVTQARWTLRLGNLLTPGLGAALRGSALGLVGVLLVAFGLGAVWSGLDRAPRMGQIEAVSWDGLAQAGWIAVVLGLLLGLVATLLGDPRAPEAAKLDQRDATRSAGGTR